MPNSTAEVVTLEGIIVDRFQPAKRGKYTVHDFRLKRDDGSIVTVSKFFEFDSNLVGRRVKFDANPNHYNGKEKYVVVKKGEISEISGVSGAETDVAQPSAPTALAPTDSSVSEELEAVREEVESIIRNDVAFCKSLLGAKATAQAVAELVQAFQATRATLIIQKSQRRRGW